MTWVRTGRHPESVRICPVTRKVGFESRRKARKRLHDLQGQGGFQLQRTYLCPHCGNWHHTSQSKPSPSPGDAVP